MAFYIKAAAFILHKKYYKLILPHFSQFVNKLSIFTHGKFKQTERAILHFFVDFVMHL